MPMRGEPVAVEPIRIDAAQVQLHRSLGSLEPRTTSCGRAWSLALLQHGPAQVVPDRIGRSPIAEHQVAFRQPRGRSRRSRLGLTHDRPDVRGPDQIEYERRSARQTARLATGPAATMAARRSTGCRLKARGSSDAIRSVRTRSRARPASSRSRPTAPRRSPIRPVRASDPARDRPAEPDREPQHLDAAQRAIQK